MATGDATGRIRVYRGFAPAVAAAAEPEKAGAAAAGSPGGVAGGDGEGQLACATWHWHAHAVLALCFAADGAYLLSGGSEAVLVRPLVGRATVLHQGRDWNVLARTRLSQG